MKTMKHLSKRGLALFIALLMCVSMLPMQAFAAGTSNLKPPSVKSTDEKVEISKTAERKTADTWEVTMSVNVNNNEIKPLPMDLVLLIDTSGSMKDNGMWVNGQYKTRLAVAKDKAKELVGALKKSNLDVNIAVVSYGDAASTNLSLTPLKTGETQINNAITKLNATGSTNMRAGLETANNQLKDSKNKKVIVMLADGDWGYGPGNHYNNNKNKYEKYDPAYSNTATTVKANAEVYTIGFSDGASSATATLRDVVASGADHYYSAADSTELANAFTAISTRVTAMVDDNMGQQVTVVKAESGSKDVLVTGHETEANVSDTRDGMTWNPANNEAVTGNVTFTYTVKANPDKIGDDGIINLNGENAYLRYKIGDTTAEPLQFPIPTDTVTVGSLTEKWVVDGTEVAGATTTQKKIFWEQDESSKTFTVAANAPEEVHDKFSTGSTLDDESWTESATVVNDGGTHVLVHYYSTEEPKATFTVTYTDGVEGETVFANQAYTVDKGTPTPAFNGTPTREGYTFTGWSPTVAATVTRNAIYTAQWKHNNPTGPLDPDPDDPSKPVIPDDPDDKHVYEFVRYETAPACTTAGVAIIKCTTHGVEFKMDVKALGHLKTDPVWHDNHEGNCAADDNTNHVKYCQREGCGVIVATAGHTCVERPATPSYEEEWYITYECECGHKYQVKQEPSPRGTGSYTVKYVDDGDPTNPLYFESFTKEDIEGESSDQTVNVDYQNITSVFTYTVVGLTTLTQPVYANSSTPTEFVFHFTRNNTTLSVEKTTTTESAKVGDKIEYTITVKNIGGHKAVNVVVDEQPDETLEILTVKKGEDVLAYNMVKKGYEVGNIEPGDSNAVVLTVTAEVVKAPAEGQPIRNIAVATLDNGDPNGSETGTDPIPGTDPENPGDGKDDAEVTYKVTVTWVDEDGRQLDQKEFTKGGTEPAQTISNPTKAADDTNTYTFKDWVKTEDENGNITYTATYTPTRKQPSPSPSTTPSNPGGGNGGGTDPTPAPRYTVNWEDGDGNIIKTTTVTGTTVPDSLYPADPEKEGSSFLGWGEPDIVGNVITIIAEWEEEFDPNDVPLIVAPGLDSTDHFAYIIGYGDGTVRPTRNITRAEVATIFYRLMTDDYRGTFWCQTNDFTDVNSGDWFNNAVSTSSEAELVKGYADGTFKGKNNITRAEFATIAARFLSDDPTGENPFTDIGSHWAKNDILKAYEAGWINGYADGTFKPNALITRAEAMTIVNRMLNRVPHAEDLLPDEMTTYPDNQPGAWYYAAVQEATNSHDYERGERDGETVETWTAMKANRDWAALEKEWSDAYSGSNGNDVM